MKVTFHDMEDPNNPANARVLSEPADVAQLFNSLTGCPPFTFPPSGWWKVSGS
jgi:hypothetical protein